MLVTVCVITCQRPTELQRLMAGLNALTFHACEPPTLEVVIVENDTSGTAQAICDEWRSRFRWPLRYYAEPRRGISYARNTAIAKVSPQAEFIACIDDDEIPEPDWLDQLLHTQKTHQADIVSGHVVPYFDYPAPQWVINGRFFERDRYPTGHVMNTAATNNVLIRADLLRQLNPVFDSRFALTGSEDSHLFRRLHRAGYKIVRSDEAIVHESVPASRATLPWLLRRSYRVGNSYTLCELALNPSPKTAVKRAIKGIGRIIQGLVLTPIAALRGRHQLVQSLQNICFGSGTLAAVVGTRYEIYTDINTISTEVNQASG